MNLRPLGLLAELTHRCPLHCPYCSNPFNLAPRSEELSAADWQRVLGEAADLGVLQVGFSGGEPLLFPELSSLIATARARGFYTNLITSGLGLTHERARELKQAGLDTIQISFQADEAGMADAIAGTRAHEKKLVAVETARSVGLPWSANVVLHRRNIDRMAEIIALAERGGAIRIELANTQFYGWAFANRLALLPTREQLMQAEAIAEAERQRLRGRLQVIYVPSDYYEMRPKACLHGWGSRSLTVNPRGEVLPCQAASAIPGLSFDSVKDKSLAWIWQSSPAFQRFRGTEWMLEPCRSCEFREVDFGGCRCQAALLAGDPAATDPVCEFSPRRSVIDDLLQQSGAEKIGDYQFRGPDVSG